MVGRMAPFHQCSWAALLCLMQFSVALGSKRPNIIFIVADDLGWNDVGWHNPDMITPNLDRLARDGVTLNQSYVQPVCSPSRSAFMTGCYPFRTGMQHGVIRPLMPKGVPTNFTFLPEKMKDLGYHTHSIGKWHLGFCDISYTPMHRGFDTHYGFYLGAESYYDHVRSGGYDFRNGTKADLSARGAYSTILFAKRAEEIITAHDGDKPLFMYLPFQAVHAPLEVPERFENMYKTIQNEVRRKYCGMVSALDEAVGNITKALEAKGMLDSTIIAFTTDNGGVASGGGNNWPLRGQKGTLWEGGTRGPAFVTGGVLKGSQGSTYDGLFHATDWFPTLLAAAGHPTSTSDLPKIDGINQYMHLLLPESTGARTELIYNADNIQKNGAIRVGDWKLIVGVAGFGDHDGWASPPTSENGDEPLRFRPHDVPPQPNLLQLFHLANDPTEHRDVSKTNPQIVKLLLQRFYELTSGYKAYIPQQTSKGNPENFGGIWSPGWCAANSRDTSKFSGSTTTIPCLVLILSLIVVAYIVVFSYRIHTHVE